MKILMLNYEFPPLGGGASPVSYEIAERLSRTGKFDIDVVTMGYKNLPKYEKINDNLKIYRVKCWRFKKEICHPWEQLTYLISGYSKCKELFKKNKYDICHCHFIIPTGILALKLKKKFGLNYIITSHGSDVLGYNPRFKKLYPFLIKKWKKILNEAKSITVPSNFLKKEILKVYPEFPKNKIQIIPNGIEKNKFFPMKKEKYILLVSRLFKNKGIQDFIKAISNLNLGEWYVRMVGEGPYRKNLENLTEKYNLQNKVEFLGWIDNESKKMRDLYGKASIFVSPSYFESFGMNIIEAMQAGAVPLLSNIGGYQSILGQEELFFKERDVDDLRYKLKNLIEKIDQDNDMCNDFIDLVKKFEWPKIINKYIELFYRYTK